MIFIVYIACFVFYVIHMAPSVTVGDAGEFMAAAEILGVAHAPGYPLFALLGKIAATAIPWGATSLRINILSAAAGAGAAATVFAVMKENLESKNTLTAAAATAAFATSIAVVRAAAQTEVFALNALFAALAAKELLAFARSPRASARRLYFAAFITGVAATNHQTIVLLMPAAAWIIFRRIKDAAPRLPAAIAAGILGFSLNIYLPIRAAANPPLNVGNPSTLSRLIRVLRRADYGTFKLTAGEKPAYDATTVLKQTRRAAGGVAKEFLPAGAALAALGGIAMAAGKTGSAAGFWLLFYIFAVPFFIFMGNLPFDAESEGILERFYVMGNIPLVFFLAAGADYASKMLFAAGRTRKNGDAKPINAAASPTAAVRFLPAAALAGLAALNAVANRSDYNWRNYYLAHDYGRNVLATLEPSTAFFMDGGDDTFYTTAYFVYARKIRSDVSLFDRGGVVFASPYGADFRRLPREEKEVRRKAVESEVAAKRPVYFSTFNKTVMGRGGVAQTGILYRAGRNPALPRAEDYFEFYSMRNVFDDFSDYRSRGLAPVYDFMRASALADVAAQTAKPDGKKRGALESAAKLELSARKWPDVGWLASNASIELEHIAYGRFADGDFDGAAKVYETLARVNPSNHAALTNLGVVYERLSLDDKALERYARARAAAPEYAPAYYNAAVIYWKRGEWVKVAELFAKVVELEPQNAAARGYLEAARNKLAGR